MNIIWKPNPLATVVQLDDHDRQILKLKLKVEQLEDRLFSAYYRIAPDYRKDQKKTLEESVTEALERIDMTHHQALAIIGASRATFDEGLSVSQKLYSDASEEDKCRADAAWEAMLEEAIKVAGFDL